MTLVVAAATPARTSSRRPVRRGWRARYPGDFPTLGWGVLAYTFAVLPSPLDEHAPFVFTDEQARRVLRTYELDPETGRRVYRRVHEEEAKGWGKSPEAAAIALAEFRGPVCFDGWDADGQPVGVPWGTHGRIPPWIQIAAVSEDQTQNTYGSLYGFLTANGHKAARDMKVDEGRTRLYLRDQPSAFLEKVTASAGSREGQRLTHAVLDEPQLWTIANGGDRLARTILRNLAKTGGWGHFTGNAPVVGMDTVAELYGDPAAGALHLAHRPSAVPQRDWTDEQLLAALDEVYGDAHWVSRKRLLDEIRDPAHPWQDSLRFFFNVRSDQRAADAWMDPDAWAACEGDVVMRAGEPTFTRVDIDHDHRAGAIAIAQRQGDQVALRVRTFPTSELLDDDYLPIAELEGTLRSLARRYRARVLVPKRTHLSGKERLWPTPGPEISYHGSFFEASAQALRSEGRALIDIPNSQERLGPASETLMELVVNGRLVHDGSDELARQVSNVVATPDPKGWRIQPATDGRRRITAARAAMVAVHRAMNAPRPPSRAMHRAAPR